MSGQRTDDRVRLVATCVARALAERGVTDTDVNELLGDPDSLHRDFALLGLGSLDWIAVAAHLEDRTGLELPEHVLLDPAYRCVAGWADALDAATSQMEEQ
jgi:hypothetical protein